MSTKVLVAAASRHAHAEELAARPTWLFSSDPPRPSEEKAVQADAIVAKAAARGHRVFDGKLDRQRLGLGERVVARAVGAADGDRRDWAAIACWAGSIADELLA
jgi:menaquinone-dependent protoporphyrinogen oxidase